jgi:flavin reductase (DIM6/NTAB) family NADH-FMN oxidoreductase RutF
MHKTIAPKILYLGTPVVLISSLNEDGTPNLAPMSSAWWLGQSCMLGLGVRGQTYENLARERECVLNLPSVDLVSAVDRLALTTAKSPVPDYKQKMGFAHVRQKFERAGLTPIASEIVKPPRVLECLIHIEAKIVRIHPIGNEDQHLATLEAQVLRVHVEEDLLDSECRHHISPQRWRPLIMSFLEFYSLGDQVHPSRLAKVF